MQMTLELVEAPSKPESVAGGDSLDRLVGHGVWQHPIEDPHREARYQCCRRILPAHGYYKLMVDEHRTALGEIWADRNGAVVKPMTPTRRMILHRQHVPVTMYRKTDGKWESEGRTSVPVGDPGVVWLSLANDQGDPLSPEK